MEPGGVRWRSNQLGNMTPERALSEWIMCLLKEYLQEWIPLTDELNCRGCVLSPDPPTPQNLAFWHTQSVFCRNVQSSMPLQSEMSWPTLANSLASGKLILPKRRSGAMWPVY